MFYSSTQIVAVPWMQHQFSSVHLHTAFVCAAHRFFLCAFRLPLCFLFPHMITDWLPWCWDLSRLCVGQGEVWGVGPWVTGLQVLLISEDTYYEPACMFGLIMMLHNDTSLMMDKNLNISSVCTVKWRRYSVYAEGSSVQFVHITRIKMCSLFMKFILM